MRVLALDTALAACSAAVFDLDRGGVLAHESRPMERGHAEALMPMIARVMSEADLEFGDLDRIAVTIGPGSFTGLRVGVAAARGLALAAHKPVVGLTTLAAFAAPHIASDDRSPLLAAIDARHDHVYMQLVGEGGRAVIPPRIASIREAARIATAAPTRLVGSAAGLLHAAWMTGARPPLCVDTTPAPDIDWVARLGAVAADTMAFPKPLYLRAPDARPQGGARVARR
ncbi:tRNA threonylcarbamoyladenosine biosynthesis protein TsaB [Rhodoplanes serenus]|uniref:tRNA threonylcarbamoyladenosine biosynthesis protein TsaB n=1 Tax=Rhodoplanes serenus TaxID=200615 RepID=A0A447CTD0_9BRAD|nr:tRNA (adenosine(37)-N6)-threonylcarbamoyltransferase complex dimerization subunit type 1 TsaB [Rhodoplanes serenus]VCU08538.1 tRNA threonylcarbamoyladenosine biosynthesis protein TsaB [Rhodoplanes serenus]